ncbi:MAG: hypothetical protein KDI92_09900 [Xanthomonadales bacterium]|nr:hypothetical protein [Xanthomonadales bacterium]
MTYYWLKKHLEQWQEAINADRKPQAVIINGAKGMGKKVLLQQIVADLLCRQSTPACGQCQNCRLHQQGFHPDVDFLHPDKEIIKVKMIRELTTFFISTPHCSDHKLAVIEDAHLMNTAASNALLKILEEPPPRGLLFLLTDRKHKLMPTIRSRCISLDLSLNHEEKAHLADWLLRKGAFTANQIGHALTLADWHPLTAVSLLENEGVNNFFHQLDEIYAALTAQQPITEVAKKMATENNVETWTFLNQYINFIAKSVLHPEKTQNAIEHPLNQLVKKNPKVLHLIMKFTDQIHLVMLNFNTQVKKQLLIESMLVDLKKAV